VASSDLVGPVQARVGEVSRSDLVRRVRVDGGARRGDLVSVRREAKRSSPVGTGPVTWAVGGAWQRRVGVGGDLGDLGSRSAVCGRRKLDGRTL
jgi:hypothetical protein